MRKLDYMSEVLMHRIKPLLGTDYAFSSPFLISTSWFFIFAKVFRNGYVVVCKTARRSATAKNGRDGHVTAPCLSIMTQRSSTGNGFDSGEITRLVATEHVRNNYPLLKSRCVDVVKLFIASLFDVVNQNKLLFKLSERWFCIINKSIITTASCNNISIQ